MYWPAAYTPHGRPEINARYSACLMASIGSENFNAAASVCVAVKRSELLDARLCHDVASKPVLAQELCRSLDPYADSGICSAVLSNLGLNLLKLSSGPSGRAVVIGGHLLPC